MSGEPLGQKSLEVVCRALRAVLLEDLSLGRALLANMRAKREALVANDFSRVSDAESQGRDLVARHEANGTRREAAIRALTTVMGLDTTDRVPRLSELIALLPAAESRMLQALRASLLECESEMRETNEQNRALVQTALDVVHFTFHTLTDLALKPTGYGTKPRGQAAPNFYLDHRA